MKGAKRDAKSTQPDAGHQLFQRTTYVRADSIDREGRSVEFVFSTERKDRHGTILRQNWRLEDFRRNPVVLFAHKSRELAVGTANNVRVDNGELIARVHFVTEEANPFAEKCWQSVLQGSLRAGSVGFYPFEYRWERIDDVEVLVFDDIELRELTVTPVGSNPDALARSIEQERAYFSPPRLRGDNQGADTVVPDDENEKLTQRIAELEKERDALKVERDVYETQNKRLVEERDAASARVAEFTEAKEEADAKAAEELEKTRAAENVAAVEALIGTKINPAERDIMIEQRASNPDLFKRMMDQRGDKYALLRGDTMGKDPTPQTITNGKGEDFAADVAAAVG